MTHLKIAGAPHLFLNRFPDWKTSNKTHMIPPVFTVKNKSTHQIGIKGSALIIDRGDQGEAIVFDLLEQLGISKKIGMFVVHGFELKDLKSWKGKTKGCQDFIVKINGEFDFVIFHHTLGIISLEVKNYSEAERSTSDALRQLETSKQVIMKFGTYGTEKEHIGIPHKKVFAMPFTKSCDFNVDSVDADINFLFEEDCQSLEAFQKWWQRVIENPTSQLLTPQIEVAYEMALSYTLMIRHLNPVVETEQVALIFHKELNDLSCHQNSAYKLILKDNYPEFWTWFLNVTSKINENFDFGDEDPKKLKEAFIENHLKKPTEENLMKIVGIEVINKLLKSKKFLSGDKPSKIDEVLVGLYLKKYMLFYENIVCFINAIRKVQTLLVEKGPILDPSLLERCPFLKLESCEDFNMLDLFLSKSSFLCGNKPTEVDLKLFEILTSRMAITTSRSHVNMVLTSEQLIVYEGPKKQLIIGPPGSGKTDLLLKKAKELENEMRRSDSKILFIIANGSPKYEESMFYRKIQEAFKKSKVIEIISLTLEEEQPSAIDMAKSTGELKSMLETGKYAHAFVDEYWIGSKPAEHKIILDLLSEIPESGYVWITSVFDYSVQQKHADRITLRTGPLLVKLKEKHGKVSRITTVLRAGNTVVNLVRGYSEIYSKRSYLYGTEKIFGHSLEGVPVTWIVEENVNGMYEKCADIVDRTIRDAFSVTGLHRGDEITLNAQDIMVANFAIRMDVKVKKSLEDLFVDKKISFQSFGGSIEGKIEANDSGKVKLLQSLTRDASSYLDGMEWPMVIVILPSGMLLNTAKLAEGAQSLRNYDPYISFFRTMVKLVVISDMWKNQQEFLKDVDKKLRKN